MKTRADFPPGTTVERPNGEWGIVVSEEKAAKHDKTCGWDKSPEARAHNVWVEWRSSSTTTAFGPILHIRAKDIKIKNIDVKSLLWEGELFNVYGTTCPYCSRVLFYYLRMPEFNEVLMKELAVYPSGARPVEGAHITCENCNRYGFHIQHLQVELLKVSKDVVDMLKKTANAMYGNRTWRFA